IVCDLGRSKFEVPTFGRIWSIIDFGVAVRVTPDMRRYLLPVADFDVSDIITWMLCNFGRVSTFGFDMSAAHDRLVKEPVWQRSRTAFLQTAFAKSHKEDCDKAL